MHWIDQQLEQRKMTRRELVGHIPGMTETKMSLVMNGRRKLIADEADAIRRFFGYRLPDDPPRGAVDLVHEQIAKLGDAQVQAVILYLEALTGVEQSHPKAS